MQYAIVAQRVSQRVLHEGVRDDDEIAGQPGTEAQGNCGREVTLRTETSLSEQKQPQEGGFQKECEDSLHREGLTDNLSSEVGETRPVGPELEFERDPRHDPHGEVEAEDARPESREFVEALVARTETQHLHDHDEQSQPNGQLRKQVVISDRKGELDTVPWQAVAHLHALESIRPKSEWTLI